MFNSSTVDRKSVVDMSEKLAPDNAAQFEKDAVVAAGDAAVVVAVDCKWIASMGVNCKEEVLLYTVAIDCTRHSTDAPASHFVRANDYLQCGLNNHGNNQSITLHPQM